MKQFTPADRHAMTRNQLELCGAVSCTSLQSTFESMAANSEYIHFSAAKLLKQCYSDTRMFSKKYTVDREYFVVTKVTWVKCSMSFNFVNLAGIRNLFNSGYFIKRSFSALLARA